MNCIELALTCSELHWIAWNYFELHWIEYNCMVLYWVALICMHRINLELHWIVCIEFHWHGLTCLDIVRNGIECYWIALKSIGCMACLNCIDMLLNCMELYWVALIRIEWRWHGWTCLELYGLALNGTEFHWIAVNCIKLHRIPLNWKLIAWSCIALPMSASFPMICVLVSSFSPHLRCNHWAFAFEAKTVTSSPWTAAHWPHGTHQSAITCLFSLRAWRSTHPDLLPKNVKVHFTKLWTASRVHTSFSSASRTIGCQSILCFFSGNSMSRRFRAPVRSVHIHHQEMISFAPSRG